MRLRFDLFLVLALLGAPAALAPAYAQITVRSPLADDRDAAPGETYEGTLIVRNESGEPQQAKLYQTDYLFQSDGSNRYDLPGSTPRSNAAWIELGERLLTLAPGETVPVTYRVRVPEEVAGSYWSLLMVEGVPKGSAESTLGEVRPEPRYGMRQVTRYGVQVATHIRGTGAAEVGFENVRLRPGEDGAKVLEVDVRNDGDRFAHSTMWIELYGTDGAAHGRRDGAAYRLYPTTSVRQQVDLSDLAPGAYEVLVIVDVGGDQVVGAQYALEL